MKIDVKRKDITLRGGILLKKYPYFEYTVTATLTEEEWDSVGKMREQNMDIRFPGGHLEAPNVQPIEQQGELLSLIYKRVQKQKKKGKPNWNSYTWVPVVYANKALAEGWFDEVLAEWQKVKDILEGINELSNIEQESSYSL